MDKLALLAIGLIISFVLFLGFDYGLGYRVSYNGIITNKIFEPAHNYTQMVMISKVMVPVTHNADDDFILKIKLNDRTIVSIHVNSNNFSLVNIGDSARVNIKVGSITKWRY